MTSNILPLHLKETFPPIIWIFTEGDDGIKSRLPFKIFSTLIRVVTKLQPPWWRDAPILWHLQSTQSPWTLPKHYNMRKQQKKFLEQNCIGIASIICILAWIIFVSFFSKPDRVTFLKRQLYWAEKSWKSRFLGQQPFLCIKVTIISEFLGCGALTLWLETH